MVENDQNELLVNNVKEQKQNNGQNIIRAIDPRIIVAAGAVTLFGAYAVSQKILTGKQLFWIIAITVLVILLLAFSGLNKSRYLTYEEAYALALKHLENRQRLLIDVPIGQISAIGEGRLKRLDNEPMEWTFGFEVIDYSNYIHIFEVLVDAKVGGIGITGRTRRQREGYDAYRQKDIFTPQPQVQGQQPVRMVKPPF